MSLVAAVTALTLASGGVSRVDRAVAAPPAAGSTVAAAAGAPGSPTPVRPSLGATTMSPVLPPGEPPTSPAPQPAHTAGTPASQTRPFQPTQLTLPSGDSTPVDAAGVDRTGALEVPDDPSRVGWWTGGALVGEPFGSVVVAGHIDSRTMGLGAMVELLDLAIGDRVVVGDASQNRTFRVVSVDAVPKAKLATGFEAFRQDVDHRLVLITCGGAYDRASQSYPDNVVVVAVPEG